VVDRLAQVRHHARLQAPSPFLGQGVGAQGDDGQVWRQCAQFAGGLVAVHQGHLQVHQHRIKAVAGLLRRRHRLDGFEPVLGEANLRALARQDPPDQEAVDLDVLGDEQAQACQTRTDSGGLHLGVARHGARLDGGQWQRQCEFAAAAEFARGDEVTPHLPGQVPRDDEPEPGAAVAAGGGAVALLECHEQARTLLVTEADAGVADRERAMVMRPGDPQQDLPALRELDRFGQQVDQHLLQPLGVAENPLGRHVVHPGRQRQRLRPGLLLHHRHGAVQYLAKLQWHRLDRHLAGLDPGEVENVDCRDLPARSPSLTAHSRKPCASTGPPTMPA
jgi:hypothetical protein